MSYEGPKSQPKPIAITRLGQHFPDYYNSISSAQMHTGIMRNTLNEALHTGKRIRKGEGCKVEYRNPEDRQTLQQKHDDFKSKKELAAFGLASTTQALSEIERLRIIERLSTKQQHRILELLRRIRELEGLLKLHNIEVTKNDIRLDIQ